MARLIAIAFALSAGLLAQQASEFQQAGVCARCHVVSVLEWGLSGHKKAGNTCTGCHGESRGHVVDERNNVKPDKIPHDAAIAALCSSCHTKGCPKTQKPAGCQECHHAHALIHPTRGTSAKDERLDALVARWEKFTALVADGDRHAQSAGWTRARASYAEALKLVPGNHAATEKLRLSERRLSPAIPGFEIAGNDVDPRSGLPKRVRVRAFDLEMVLVPGGDFEMGSDHLAGSKPVHTVRVRPFYLAIHEVTQGQWQQLMGANPSAHATSGRLPVEQVSWEDAQAFLSKLNERVPGGGFRLPAEAEWERAAQGMEPASETAWFRENALVAGRAAGPFLPVEAYAPHPVGSKQPNSLGLYDLLGNVWEWCSSLNRAYPYDASDGREAPGGADVRILRGGSYADSREMLNPALRHSERPGRRQRWNGLRVARSAPGSR